MSSQPRQSVSIIDSTAMRGFTLSSIASRQASTASRRRSALSAYRSHLDDRDVDAALTDLLHLHHTRMIGGDADSERMCLRLARALAQQARHQERSRAWSPTSKHAAPQIA